MHNSAYGNAQFQNTELRTQHETHNFRTLDTQFRMFAHRNMQYYVTRARKQRAISCNTECGIPQYKTKIPHRRTAIY